MRVYELSKKLGITNKDLLKFFLDNNYEIKSHIAAVPEEASQLAINFFSSKKSKSNIKPESSSKSKKMSDKDDQKKASEQIANAPKISETEKSESADLPAQLKNNSGFRGKQAQKFRDNKIVQEPKKVVIPRASMSVSEFAEESNKPVGEVILTLLRQGIVAAKNQIINKDVVEKLAAIYELELAPLKDEFADKSEHEFVIEHKEENLVQRMPIIVVIGHVDHGKTTLLDYIRKSRVALKEKGGITQHLGAYKVESSAGPLIFLDTPGHEAFNLIRARGVKSADIAVLVVAADDGVMPQTVEAIKHAKAGGIPIVVAINKIDKATPAQVEAVKSQLAQHDLLPEDWGGDVACVSISAKEGTGVDELLDILQLQSQLMELKADTSISALGYILESKLQKGRGPVATVICTHGILKLGDYFVSGRVSGKVSSLTDSAGNALKRVCPSEPVQVAGFDALPQAGDPFEVVPQAEVKKRLESQFVSSQRATSGFTQKEGPNLSLIVKADNASSKEAVIGAIKRISEKLNDVAIEILYSNVGDISERDVMLASDTGSSIYGLHVKLGAGLNDLVQRNKVKLKTFDIIYKLLEDVEATAKSEQPVKYTSVKVGEAVVIKTFDVKNIGTIAGALVKSGRFVKDGTVVAFRGKNKIGSGQLKSLQREHKNVKEVHSGFEFAFFTNDFQDWQLDDRVECYHDVPEQ